METILNNVFYRVLFVSSLFIPSILLGQTQLDIVFADNLNIDGLGYKSNFSQVREKFGNPKQYSEYDDPLGLSEGHDKLFYFTYDSMKITFFEYNNNISMSSFNVEGSSYKINFNNKEIIVGMNLEILKVMFPKSHLDYLKRYARTNPTVKNFYVTIAMKYPKVISYDGILNIKIVEDRIHSIAASFDPA